MTITETDPLQLLANRLSVPAVDPDPVRWAKDTLNVDLWSKQREILRLLEFVPKLAVPSCHDAGKSFIAAMAAARFLAKWPPGTARVVSTAPTMTQVRAILWNEINALHDKSGGKLPGRTTQTEWYIGNWQAGLGRKPSDYAQSTFQGLHAEHILIIVDEAGGIPNGLWTGVDTLSTNEGAVILAIGNPDDPQAQFKTICEDAPENGWTVVKIPAWETPNLSGEPVTPKLKSVLLSASWVEGKRMQWGEDSPLWAAKVAAEFPLESGMNVVRLMDLVTARRGEELMEKSTGWAAQVQLGVDVAASDQGDETIIRERRGNILARRWSVQSGEPEAISDLMVQAAQESGATLMHVDATGVGFGFLADVRRRVPDIAVLPFIAAGQATDPKQFENRRAEAHWTVRERLRRRELDLSQADEYDELAAQLTAARYSIKKGRILVEPKADIRKRIGRSPDDGDAAQLAIIAPSGERLPTVATVRAASSHRRSGSTATTTDVVPYTGPRAIPEQISAPQMPRTHRTLRARYTPGS